MLTWVYIGLLARKRSARYQALHQDDAPRQGTEPDLEAQTGDLSSAGRSATASPGVSSSPANEAAAIQLKEVAPEPVKGN